MQILSNSNIIIVMVIGNLQRLTGLQLDKGPFTPSESKKFKKPSEKIKV